MTAKLQDPVYLRKRAQLFRSDAERNERDDTETYGHLHEDHPLRVRARLRAKAATASAENFERRAGLYEALREDG